MASGAPHSRFDGPISDLAGKFEAVARVMLRVVLSFLKGAPYSDSSRAVEEAGDALKGESERWVDEYLPRVYSGGVKQSLDSPETRQASVSELSRDVHDQTLALFQEELVEALGAATENMSRDAKESLREIARRRLAASLDSGTNARDEARKMDAEMRKRGVSFVDRGGRRWNPRDYAEMVLRTHTVAVSNEGNLNTAAELGSPGVRVFDGGPGDVDLPCERANGQVWGLAYARANKLEHPQCRRAFAPLPSTFDGDLDRE